MLKKLLQNGSKFIIFLFLYDRHIKFKSKTPRKFKSEKNIQIYYS